MTQETASVYLLRPTRSLSDVEAELEAAIAALDERIEAADRTCALSEEHRQRLIAEKERRLRQQDAIREARGGES